MEPLFSSNGANMNRTRGSGDAARTGAAALGPTSGAHHEAGPPGRWQQAGEGAMGCIEIRVRLSGERGKSRDQGGLAMAPGSGDTSSGHAGASRPSLHGGEGEGLGCACLWSVASCPAHESEVKGGSRRDGA